MSAPDGDGTPDRSTSSVVAADDPAAVERVVAALRSGGAVVVPTDTVYGLAALPSTPGAVERLFALKGRRPEVPLAVLVTDADSGASLAAEPSDGLRRAMDAHWPGPLTLVLRRGAAARGWDLGGEPATIGVRCPAHPLLRAVAAEVGPIATTSANRHGSPTPPAAVEAAASLTAPVALVVDGGPLAGTASTVIDATTSEWKVLREGAISLAEVRASVMSGGRER